MGAEVSNYWLSPIWDLQNRGVQDALLAAIDGFTGFKGDIHSFFPKIKVQRFIIHHIRYILKYEV
jgi:transposase-like protein